MERKANTRGRGRPSPHQRGKAAAKDVVGHVETVEDINPPWRRYYRRLLDLRNDLRGEKRRLRSDAMEEYTGPRRNPADVATNTSDRDTALALLSSEQDALYEIDEALNRIRTGGYGVCELTGQRIPRERLDAMPWTRFSAEAERQLEQQGEVSRTRLGELKRVPREQRPEGFDEEHELPAVARRKARSSVRRPRR